MTDTTTSHEARVVMVRNDLGYTAGYQAVCECGTTGPVQARGETALRDQWAHLDDIRTTVKETTT